MAMEKVKWGLTYFDKLILASMLCSCDFICISLLYTVILYIYWQCRLLVPNYSKISLIQSARGPEILLQIISSLN